jgi:glycogen synthase
MSDYVAQTGCGTVVEQVTAVDILMALAQLRENYTAFQAMARRAGQQDFTLKAMLDSYQEMYERVMRST